MGIRKYKPTSAGRRISSVDMFEDLTASKPFKQLTKSRKVFAGRTGGKITVRHQGGGAKQRIRLIDWKRDKFDIPATVSTIEYDPNRGARIALVVYSDGEKRYILAQEGLKVGQKVISSKSKGDVAIGNRYKLNDIPVGVEVSDVELAPGSGSKIVRGAGTAAQIMAIEDRYALLRIPSGEIRKVLAECMATIGRVSNADRRLIRWGKAGRTRHRGIRPTVRGKAMNPVDHPHGGGEGHNPIGLKHPKTPQGKPALGVKTRRKKASDALIIQRRNAVKK
ncbi:MAG: hypothetical protein ACD_76C00094G0011 [uncultured bacterium]|nr:MAG: hypothetical protein ACD_76C00094G0011 [uncultured bacterium]HBD05266.1 50S ribosomal protein L2 [Candidatus Uhrbacteria bacterium]